MLLARLVAGGGVGRGTPWRISPQPSPTPGGLAVRIQGAPTGALPGGAATPVVFWVLLGAAVLRASPWVCVVGVVSGPTTGGWCSRIHTQILPRGPV